MLLLVNWIRSRPLFTFNITVTLLRLLRIICQSPWLEVKITLKNASGFGVILVQVSPLSLDKVITISSLATSGGMVIKARDM